MESPPHAASDGRHGAAVTGFRRARERGRMRASTIIIAVGAVVFVIPIPGLFIVGALIILGGVVARLLGH